MKLKKAIKYNLVVTGKSMITFYCVVAAVYIFLTVLFAMLDGIQGNASMEMAAMIFLFSVGVVFYSEYFKMFLQNGISRKTMFISVGVSLFIGAAVMSLLDTLIGLVMSNAGIITPLMRMIYGARIAELSAAQSFIELFFLSLTLYFFLAVLGYFVGIVFAKLSKTMRIVLPVGLPVLLIAGVILDLNITNGNIMGSIGKFFLFVSGFQNDGNMNILTVSCLCFALIFLLLSWLLIRRATVNDAK